MELLATAAFLLFTAGGAALLAGFLLWHPVSAQVQKRVDVLVTNARKGGNRAASVTPSPGMDVLKRLLILGMPRKWGVNTRPWTLVLLGLVAGSAAWLLCHQIFTLPLTVALPLVAITFWIAPQALARMEQRKADNRFIDLFPDAIDMIVRMLRANLPVSAAIRTVAQEAPAPISDVFTSLADQIDIGIAFEDALGVGSERIGLPDFRFFAAAVALQHGTGGNLVSTLEILGDIIRKRRALRMKARAATAEERMSAYVLSAIPFVVIGTMLIVSPDYMAPLLLDPRGHVILLIAALMLLLAFLSMRYMMRSATRL